LILNGEKYRRMVALEMKRARDRKAQAKWREKQKARKARVPFLTAAGMTPQQHNGVVDCQM
jgi:isocitrate dehydrogenase kinase/phosphatase